MSSALAIATEAFGKTLEELGIEPDLKDPAAVGRRAALLAVADTVWGRQFGPLFDSEQVGALLGVSSRQAVSDLAKRGRLLVLDSSRGRKLYPAFQFGRNGRPYRELVPVLELFSEVVETPHTIASWFTSPNSSLENQTPVDWLRAGRGSAQLLEAARRSAARLAH